MFNTWKFSGKTRTVPLSEGKKSTEYLISPTCLQTLLAHHRNHPNDKVGRHALRLYSDDEIQEMLTHIPPAWWVSQSFYDAANKE